MSSGSEFQTVGPATEKSPTAVRAEPVAWNGDLMTDGRTQTLAENSVRYWCAVVGQIPRSLVVLASVQHEYAGGPTATLGTDVSWLPVEGCGTAFQLVLGKRTSAMNSLSGC